MLASDMLGRALQGRLQELAGPFPVVFLTGPRQSGKTTLARATFPDFTYRSLEDLQTRQFALDDPRGYLGQLQGARGVILDEVQRAPDLFSSLQQPVDERRVGPVILTGSQQFLLSHRISQSLAGRAAVLELLPFSVAELCERPALQPDALAQPADVSIQAPSLALDDLLVSGCFPPIHDRHLPPDAWLDGYIRTYVERDVRMLANIGNLDTFLHFLALCAGRSGQLLNLSALGGEVGISHTTARSWISVLRAGYVLELLPPHHESFNTRQTKAPKLHFLDTGLLCHLLGLRSSGDLRTHPLRGAIFETFVVAELRKLFLHRGQRPPLFFWRAAAGREVDIVIDHGTRRLPVEIKASQTIAPDAFRQLDAYIRLAGGEGGVLVYAGDDHMSRGPHQVRPWWACT